MRKDRDGLLKRALCLAEISDLLHENLDLTSKLFKYGQKSTKQEKKRPQAHILAEIVQMASEIEGHLLLGLVKTTDESGRSTKMQIKLKTDHLLRFLEGLCIGCVLFCDFCRREGEDRSSGGSGSFGPWRLQLTVVDCEVKER
jgi:hypothetical protein